MLSYSGECSGGKENDGGCGILDRVVRGSLSDEDVGAESWMRSSGPCRSLGSACLTRRR